MSAMIRRTRAFTLVELMLAIPIMLIVMFVLGKLVIDGIYLQRIATQQANRQTVITALMNRLRADALGAAVYEWSETGGRTLTLSTSASGAPRRVCWTFGKDDVRRTEDGRDAGSFAAERLHFDPSIENGSRSDVLTLDLAVDPPSRAHQRKPLVFSEKVLLPPRGAAGATAEQESAP
jgi:type II secretory pathway component PulJ